MPLVEFNTRPGRIPLQRFASIGLPVALGVVAAIAWRNGSPWTAYVLAGVAAVTFLLGRQRPLWFRPLYVANMAIGYPFAWLLGLVLLAAVFYLLVAPIGWILRHLGRDPLARRFDREAQSYWVARAGSDSRQRYFRQY